MAIPQSNLSYLDIVDLCDNVHLRRDSSGLYDTAYNSEPLVPLYLSESPESAVIGLLRPAIVQQLVEENVRSNNLQKQELWKIRVQPADFITLRNGTLGPSVSLCSWLDSPSKRTDVMKELCELWRDTGLFADVCGPTKWRAEMYPIYADPHGVHDHPSTSGRETGLNFAFEMERSACALFGVVTYGIHMSVYEETVQESGENKLRVWIPTRALTKPTFPGYLDNTVAGGIPSGMSMFESLVKECMEEASLEEYLVRKYSRAVGVISYFYRSSKGWLQPEIEYVYEIKIPRNVDSDLFTPRPSDGEVESFDLASQERLVEQLRAGLFKPNCGLVILDLLIRRGYITPDNEPDFVKIANRLHGNFSYQIW
ncbi:nudix hydrolase 20 [Panaeolus papilionaceus]|nr:nudix hydrolase 20 [Panaeolus papilionaceus]